MANLVLFKNVVGISRDLNTRNYEHKRELRLDKQSNSHVLHRDDPGHNFDFMNGILVKKKEYITL